MSSEASKEDAARACRNNDLGELCKMRGLEGANFQNVVKTDQDQRSTRLDDTVISCEPLPSTSLSLLHIAALYDSLDCFIFLHKVANLPLRQTSAESYLPIHYACFNGSYEVLSYIIANDPEQAAFLGAGLHYHPIYLATRSGSAECLRLLLEHGADLAAPENNKNKPVQTALKYHNADCLKLLLGRDQRRDEIDGATHYSPLMLAIAHGLKDAVRLLLEVGEDPSFITPDPNKKVMPLFLACDKGPEWAEEVELICSKMVGATDVDDSYSGKAAIHYACASGSPRILEAVCGRGVDVTKLAQDNMGHRTNTAVHYLVQNDKVEDRDIIRMLEILVRHGFDIRHTLTPFIKGPQQKRYDVIEWILDHPQVDPNIDGCIIDMELIAKRRAYDRGARRMYEILKAVKARDRLQ